MYHLGCQKSAIVMTAVYVILAILRTVMCVTLCVKEAKVRTVLCVILCVREAIVKTKSVCPPCVREAIVRTVVCVIIVSGKLL